MNSTTGELQSESALIHRALAGDRDAFYALVQPCESAIFMAAWAILKNDVEAEEVAQEAVLKALADLQHFRWEWRFSAWMVRITIEQAHVSLRNARRNSDGLGAQQADDEYTPKDLNDWYEIPCDMLQHPRFRAALTEAIASLDVQSRMVIVLRDVQKFSVAETSKILGCSEADVRARLGGARLRIRDQLAPGMNANWAAA